MIRLLNSFDDLCSILTGFIIALNAVYLLMPALHWHTASSSST